MPIPLLLGAAPGLIKAGASLFGAKKRKKAEQAAQEKATQAESDVANFKFENQYKNQENVYEDATVNQQAANFQAGRNDQTLSSGLDQFVQSGGGGGGAQAFVQASLNASQDASADLTRQETTNQNNQLGEQSQLNYREAQGEETLQDNQFGQAQQQSNIANTQLGEAKAARAQGKADLFSGIGSAIGGIAGGLGGKAGAGKGIGSKLKGLFGGAAAADPTAGAATPELNAKAAAAFGGNNGLQYSNQGGGGGGNQVGSVDVGQGGFGGAFDDGSGSYRELKRMYRNKNT